MPVFPNSQWTVKMASKLLNCPVHVRKVGRWLHLSDSRMFMPQIVCHIFSLLALSSSLLPGLCLTQLSSHAHKDTHTLPEHKCQPIFHILFPKMSLPWTKRVCLPSLLAVCPLASHLNLLSLPDISHAPGVTGQTHRLNIPKVCHARLGWADSGMKVKYTECIKYTDSTYWFHDVHWCGDP